MYLIFLSFWIMLNGRFTWEIFLFGLAISAAVYLFICRFMDYSLRKDFLLLKNTGLFLAFLGVLVKEIAKANLNVLRLILSQKYRPEPALIYFKTDLKSGICKVLLANSITLTPGTITVSVEGNEFCVHCLDKDMAEGIEESDFVRLLRKMEAGR
ncbi:Na+/H+ antiporter subunit E [Qiania dongpingensis]|uniref:Na+/H+ antiporter subunit E n=1 Tax=Qiania dongpingensis TaxID=2763669 RepID=A0A7G9G3U9_9FIRM|nr:Na+/H+ antiporter subunit E [Qiania dongpingensis]QNM05481.1 Na+/H+ antiporter subunit E [Qiania dongpingensis]